LDHADSVWTTLDIVFITKTNKQKIVLVFCWCVYLFLAKNLYFESQTNRKLKIYLRIKNCLARAGKMRSIITTSQSLIAMEFSFRPAHFPINRSVALHAYNLGPPCYKLLFKTKTAVTPQLLCLNINVDAKMVQRLHDTHVPAELSVFLTQMKFLPRLKTATMLMLKLRQ